MHSILITPKSQAEFDLMQDLLKRMRIKARVLDLTDEEKEDLGLSILMDQADRASRVSREDILSALDAE